MNALGRTPAAVSDADVDRLAARLRLMARTDPERYAAIIADMLAAEAEDARRQEVTGADVIDLSAARAACAARLARGRRRARSVRPDDPRQMLAEADALRATLAAVIAAEDAVRPRLRLVRDE